MATMIDQRKAWLPATPDEKQSVREAVNAILRSPHFCNSKRYPAFLDYVVGAVLEGRADELKERTLGIEVFGRTPDYDTNSDTVVRYTAGEVRKRLALYYADAADSVDVRIHLPVGSYVPELIRQTHPQEAASYQPRSTHTEPEPARLAAAPAAVQQPQGSLPAPDFTETHSAILSPGAGTPALMQPPRAIARNRWKPWRAAAALLLLLGAVLAIARRQSFEQRSADGGIAQFWLPVLNAQGDTLICSGSVIFRPQSYSGVETAPRDADYSFISVQIAQSIARLSGFLERHHAVYTIRTSGSTSLTDLRERPVVMLGGYNNDWTLRLLQPLRFHFAADLANPAILDSQRPQQPLIRDRSLDYGSADDYAIVARFNDSTTHGPVVVLAGLGRNGTEAATQFVTSPEFLKAYTTQHPLAPETNIEFVLRSRVIDGKTGAPAIIAVYTW